MNSQGSLELLREEKIKIGSRNQPLGDMSKEIIISKANNGILTDYAEKLAEDYTQDSDLKKRKSKGQFFTQREIGLFMARMFDVNKSSFNILDPGAGIGMLSAAFCERLLNSQKTNSISPDFDTFEWQEKRTLFNCNRLQQINSKRQM